MAVNISHIISLTSCSIHDILTGNSFENAEHVNHIYTTYQSPALLSSPRFNQLLSFICVPALIQTLHPHHCLWSLTSLLLSLTPL